MSICVQLTGPMVCLIFCPTHKACVFTFRKSLPTFIILALLSMSLYTLNKSCMFKNLFPSHIRYAITVKKQDYEDQAINALPQKDYNALQNEYHAYTNTNDMYV